MLETVHSVVVLLTTRYTHRLLVMSLAGGHADDVVVSPAGSMVVSPGVAVRALHCIETGEDLTLDEDYAVFHTGDPQGFTERFVPALRAAVAQIGWPTVKASLQKYLDGE